MGICGSKHQCRTAGEQEGFTDIQSVQATPSRRDGNAQGHAVSQPQDSATERTRATHLLLASDSDDERAHQGDSDLGCDSLFPLQVPQPHSVPVAADANADAALDQMGPQPGVEPAMQQPQAEAAGVQEAAPGEPAAPPGQQQQQQALARTSTRLEHRSSGSPLGQIREGETLQETASQRLLSVGGTEAAAAGPSTSGAMTTGSRTLSGASAGSPLSSRGNSLEAGLEGGGTVWHDSAGSAPPDRMSRDGFEQYIKSRLTSSSGNVEPEIRSWGRRGNKGMVLRALSEYEADTTSSLPPQQARDAYLMGAPKPVCQEERERTADGIYALQQFHDGEVESILRLLCKVFNTNTASMTFLTGKCIHILEGCGSLSHGVCPDRWGFCGWSFLNDNHELLVVEDLKRDARFSANFFVTDPTFNLQFYAAAPLIASNGHRLGTLCICANEPRKFDASKAAMLANLSELAVRQAEHRWAVDEHRKHNVGLMRQLSCYEQPFLFVDISEPGAWRVLHMNYAAIEQIHAQWSASMSELASFAAGRAATPFTGAALRNVLDVPAEAMSMDVVGKSAFVVKGVAARAYEDDEDPCQDIFDLHFRLATGPDGPDAASPFRMGVPADLDDNQEGSQCFYIVALVPFTGDADSVALSQVQVHASQASGPFEDLLLGSLLGKGSFGSVYRGLHHGRRVAVKIIEVVTCHRLIAEGSRREPPCTTAHVSTGAVTAAQRLLQIIEDVKRLRLTAEGEPLEAVLCHGLHHMGVTQTYGWAMHPSQGHNGQQHLHCWMLMQYLDRGSLVVAVVKGWFRTSRDPTKGGPDYRAIAMTALEVASAMAFLHSHDIIHGDLSGGNVMLTSSDTSLHGFCAKVADFGLARMVQEDNSLGHRVKQNQYGTVTHMPPEVLLEDDMGKETDVYSWGVLLWEMSSGARAWANLRFAQVICQVALKKQSLAIPEGMPPQLAALGKRALAFEPSERPQFTDVVAELQQFLQESRGIDYKDVYENLKL